MFFWLIYSGSTALVCYFLSKSFSKDKAFLVFFFLIVLFLTPNSIEPNSNTLAPCVFIFFYDLLLEQRLSFRSLRPLVISLPLSIIFLWLNSKFRRRFS